MSHIELEAMFKPQSVAVIGATNDSSNPGNIVMRNLMGGGFMGPVMPVSADAQAIAGVLTYKDVESLPLKPDLAVICTPLGQAPDTIMQLGSLGCRTVILAGPGFGRVEQEERERLESLILDAVHLSKMRMLGPKCLGVIVPAVGLNASLSHIGALPGRISFISQSDSLFTTVLDWARTNGIGFSHCISLGLRMDVAFDDIMDYLSADPMTKSILLYVESVIHAREFMSAARAASRNKPVLVIRPGTALERIHPVKYTDLSEIVPTSNEIHEVAFRRAGMLRVPSIDNLFDSAQTLIRLQPVRGNRLAIMSNGGSAGLMAADNLLTGGGELSEFSEGTREKLAAILGEKRTGNPVAMDYNASGKQYAEVLGILLKDPDVHAVLVQQVPFSGLPEEEAAEAVAKVAAKAQRMVLTSWMGAQAAQKARKIFHGAGIPTFDTPDKAIRAFLDMAEHKRSQELLIETPDSLPPDFFPDTTAAREIVAQVLHQGRDALTEPEAKDVLGAYGVPVVETRITKSARDAVIAADEMGYPVALKLRSPQIPQPFQVGGVILDLEGPEKVWEGAAGILTRVSRQRPDAYIEGFTVQKMGRRPGAHELFLSAHLHEVFGPVITFGHGGMAREMIMDRAVALPPLNMSLARELISRTRISKLLSGTPSSPAADLDDICLTLIQISQLLIDVPNVVDIDINPLFADDKGVIALNAKIRVAEGQGVGCDRLAIRPYPRELEECVALKTGQKVLLRPIRPEDEPNHYKFLAQVSDEDMRMRFFGVVQRNFDHKDMARFTQIDYDREMAFIATTEEELPPGTEPETLGVIRTSTTPDNESAEFAIVVRSDMKGTGLGKALFEKMIRYTRERGTKRLVGETLLENQAMQGLSKRFGFEISPDRDEEMVKLVLRLND